MKMLCGNLCVLTLPYSIYYLYLLLPSSSNLFVFVYSTADRTAARYVRVWCSTYSNKHVIVNES